MCMSILVLVSVSVSVSVFVLGLASVGLASVLVSTLGFRLSVSAGVMVRVSFSRRYLR